MKETDGNDVCPIHTMGLISERKYTEIFYWHRKFRKL